MLKKFSLHSNAKHISVFSICFVVILIAIACKTKNTTSNTYVSIAEAKANDSIVSLAAFEKVYTVLMHPRCMNCHPSGDIPLQGDDSHIHNMLPQRGPDGKGITTMKCANCHAATGVSGAATPPGNPMWHLPPANMKMVFQGRSPRELALQLVNPETNGHKSLAELRHHAEDTLVKTGWHMGGDRTLPPMSYNEFKEAWYAWIDHGAWAPAK